MGIKERIITPEKAIAAAVALVQIAGNPWMKTDDEETDTRVKRGVSFAQFDFGAGFAECTLSIGFDQDAIASQTVSNDESALWSIQKPRVQIILGTDRLSPVQAMGAFALWKQVSELGALIQATLEKMTIGYKV